MHEPMGAAVVSVDVTTLATARSRSREQKAILAQLVRHFEKYGIAATWALSDPADAETADQIFAGRTRHEIALLGDARWIGEKAGRPAFACNLARRIITAQAAGLSISVLACRGACVPRSDYDLLVKHNIAVVRQSRAEAGRSLADFEPRLLRHGVWETPPTAEIPRADAWWGAGAGAAKAAIDAAATSGRVAHVAIDLAALCESDPRLHAVEGVLRCIAKVCSRGAMTLLTLGELGERLTRPKEVAASRSILRAA